MKKLHPSYEMFVREHKPKYGKTFLEWFAENEKIGEVDLLTFLRQKNSCFKKNDDLFPAIFYENISISYFSDFFTKQLDLCQNQIGIMVNENINYEQGVVAKIMDMYEDIIQEICIRENVYVTHSPIGYYRGNTFSTENVLYDNINDLKEEMSKGIMIVHYFRILENTKIQIKHFKREALTRTVLFEK